MRHFAYGLMGALFALGCSRKSVTEPAEIESGLHQYILTEVPADIENRTFIDFDGKVHLVGYDISPPDVTPPGKPIDVTFYWRSISPLGPDWRLFTHILEGDKMANFDYAGPLRDLKPGPDGQPRPALGPSRWESGKVYVDKQNFQMPTCLRQVVEKGVDCVDIASPEVTLAVGVWKETVVTPRQTAASADEDQAKPERLHLRLEVLSGKSDGQNRAIVKHLRTGIAPKRVATKAQP
jgi:hypothetical protein